MRTITLHAEGTVSHIGDLPIDLPLLNPVRLRVSIIQPTSFWRRKAFRLLRTVFGDAGRVAAFTRTWQCEWTATILATGETYTADSRAECVAWELETLNS